jgi:hypothetical protein
MSKNTPKIDTQRVPVTLALPTLDYLHQLVELGTHGTRVTDVAKALIEQGIREAIKDGLLKTRNSEIP